jgi:hypothetical protein
MILINWLHEQHLYECEVFMQEKLQDEPFGDVNP